MMDKVMKVFEHIQELNRFNLQSKLESLKKVVGSLLNLLIRICIFVREYLRPSFLGEQIFYLHLSMC